ERPHQAGRGTRDVPALDRDVEGEVRKRGDADQRLALGAAAVAARGNRLGAPAGGDREPDRLADGDSLERVGDAFPRADGLAVDLRDQVAGEELPLCRAAGDDAFYEDALSVVLRIA